MLDMEPGPAAAPVHGVAGVNDMAAAAAAAAGAQLWELALLRRHESPAVAKAAADLSSIPVDGESLACSYVQSDCATVLACIKNAGA